jgi:Uma2 family endonuclease
VTAAAIQWAGGEDYVRRTGSQRATIEDLYRVEGKAELVNGEIVYLMPTGGEPGYAGDEIFVSLRVYARQIGRGRAVGDNKCFRVDLPHRESFSPDAAFYEGPNPGMCFYEGAPVFAAGRGELADAGGRSVRDRGR